MNSEQSEKVLLSIIIVNYNTKELLEKCIASIVSAINHQPLAIGLEIIVVDNGSGEKVKSEELRMKSLVESLKLKIIRNDQNLGFARANNQGIKIAQGEYILLLNSDTEIKEGAVEKLVGYLEKNDDVAAVSPQLLNPDGTRQVDYYMKFPNLQQILLYHNIFLRPIIMKTSLKKMIVSKMNSVPFAVDQLPASALMAKKEVFEKLKGFDEDYSFLFEDVDLCYRIKKMDLGKLVVVPDAEIMHIGGASWKKRWQNDKFSFYKQYFSSLLLFIKKHYPRRLWQFKLALAFTFLVNSFTHFLTLSFKKSFIQVKLAYEFISRDCRAAECGEIHAF